jgi:hypothetical protein
MLVRKAKKVSYGPKHDGWMDGWMDGESGRGRVGASMLCKSVKYTCRRTQLGSIE